MKTLLLQAEAVGESFGEIIFYIIIIGLGLYLYFKMRNKTKKR